MMMLKGEGVSKNFGGLMAVSNANFHVNQGEIAGLIGPNGAGKTTLFNLISGAVRPASGKIIFKDENITGLNHTAYVEEVLPARFNLPSCLTE